MATKRLDNLEWTGFVDAIPVGHVIQYREKDTGKVVYWHGRLPTVQATFKRTTKGKLSNVRMGFIDRVEKGELFITHCP
jgi:hypothetical protein